MHKTIAAPTTLAGAIRYFTDPDVSLAFLAGLRWPDGVTCPVCGSDRNSFLKTRRIWKCKGCGKQFSVKLGTIFEDSPIGLDKWLPAIWLLVNAKNGISSYELHRALGVTQKTAWFMLHRIRLAMQTKTFNKFKGDVEVDESYIGGLARFMHKGARKSANQRAHLTSKTAVMALLERHGNDPLDKGVSQVRLSILRTTRRHELWAQIHQHIEPGSEVFTDAFPSYRGLEERYVHKVIDHAECYAKGKVHTNGLENFWSLLKRGIKGTYVAVEPFHLFRYLDEQVFRSNHRRTKDVARFVTAVGQIIGKRLTYADLIGQPATT
jgi:transposase-like protein